jgi:hypothetical protein
LPNLSSEGELLRVESFQALLVILQGSLDLGEVDGDAVDLALYPATYLRDLSDIRAERSLLFSESSNVGVHKLKRLR